ncbi:Beta-lactamase hydrolase-like protein [Fundidesulfovibrio magnetotacticus]|uniref:Beta-lactamase hydrolase-like protein n=1 Tax=Fundidesulfovibrio magnetotacticus TaxID=2730080 RepID=A0A6V8LSS6_9BACT|nr:protein tyrosine phosphatase family protein [Fundidesulfovibrio magnetotacticus]GFK94010.1 Beta-lactamase hydrolase-like protein [Fundidesulfovibrio magnetotacticus]
MTDPDILNFVRLDDRLACAGQPLPGHFPLLAARGFRAVVNLATEASTGHLPGEAALCRAEGLDFSWIPVPWDAPTSGDFQAFEAWLAPRRAGHVLVHCAKNWRASLFCALYRVLHEGRDPEKAREDVLEVWEPDAAWSALAREVLASRGRDPFLP